MVSAVLLASFPATLPVYLAEVLHGFASCVIGPAIAAVSIQVVKVATAGRSLGWRLGRNAQFSSIGNGAAAGVLGAVGSYWSDSAVFWITAAVMGAGLLSLRGLPNTGARLPRPDYIATPGAMVRTTRALVSRRFVLFILAIASFQLSNAAMLPLVAGEITRSAGRYATLVIAAGIVVPQFAVAALSGRVGVLAERWGRRPVLAVGFVALPVRGFLLAWTQDPVAVVLVQALDGLSGAALGVLTPLVAADLAERLGAFNLCMGLFGLSVGLGATFSTLLAGVAADAYGTQVALLGLAGAGVLATALVALMPERRPGQQSRGGMYRRPALGHSEGNPEEGTVDFEFSAKVEALRTRCRPSWTSTSTPTRARTSRRWRPRTTVGSRCRSCRS